MESPNYDGRIKSDPVRSKNSIDRAYAIAALHPDPKDVLEIGLSGGSWARVIADYRPVRHLTVIEINAAYIDLISRYEDSAPLLTDPDVSIHIDDGRRWLHRHPDARFDLIVQNTTHHWRSHVSQLLSIEFFGLCKAHLRPGGVMYLNATGSEDVAYTMANVFEHVVRYRSFVADSDAPFTLDASAIRRNLLAFERGGQPIYEHSDAHRARLAWMLERVQLRDEGDALRSRSDLIIITDDNMATEFKIKARLYDPKRRWARLFAPRDPLGEGSL